MNFEHEEMAEIVQDVNQSPNIKWSWEFADGREQWLGLGCFATLYFRSGTARQARDKAHIVVDCIDRFNAMIGNKFVTGKHPDSSRPHPFSGKRLPQDWHAYTENYHDGSLTNINYGFTSEKAITDSPEFALSSKVRLANNTEDYNNLRFDFTLTWWRSQQVAFGRFLRETARQLGAEQGYMGLGFARPLDLGASADIEGLEYQLAQHFYGLDIEQPFWNGFENSKTRGLPLGGMRPLVWAGLVGGPWLQKLGGADALVNALRHDAHPAIRTEVLNPDQVWIEVGDEPQIHPVTEPVPADLAFVAKVMRPARGEELSLSGMARWDDDDDMVFTPTESRRWLKRFDDDSDWPTPEIRQPPQTPEAPSRTATLSALPGEPCPKDGLWFAPHLGMKEVNMRQGDPMPSMDEAGRSGSVIWYWKAPS